MFSFGANTLEGFYEMEKTVSSKLQWKWQSDILLI